MARKDPYAPEEGIIDLFDVVDNPEEFPELEPRGDLYDDRAQALPDPPDAASPEDPSDEGAERVMSRYPFENSDDFLDDIEKTPLMTLLPPKEAGSALTEKPVSGEAEDGGVAEVSEGPAREEPDEALIRAFEAEMAKAGAMVQEYGVDAETVPGVPDESGMPSEPEDPVVPADAAEPEVADGHPEAQEMPDTEPAERTYAEDLELLFGGAPVPDDPQAEPLPCAAETAAMETPAPASPEGEDAGGVKDGVSQQSEAAPEEAALESPEPPVPPAAAEAFVPAVAPEMPANAAEPSSGYTMEERIIRLEEALSRLNERVDALEQRTDGADGQEPVVAALSGDIQSLLTEGNALCGQLKSLAETFASAPAPLAEPSETALLSSPTATSEDAGLLSNDAAPVSEGEETDFSASEDDPDDSPDVLGLALESLERRIGLLESRPVQAADAAGIAQDVLALVRVDMEKASEEQEASARILEQLERRVQDLESRPLPQLILPDLPDTEAITADVMSRIQNELDRIAAETAARVLREEIAGLMRK